MLTGFRLCPAQPVHAVINKHHEPLAEAVLRPAYRTLHTAVVRQTERQRRRDEGRNGAEVVYPVGLGKVAYQLAFKVRPQPRKAYQFFSSLAAFHISKTSSVMPRVVT